MVYRMDVESLRMPLGFVGESRPKRRRGRVKGRFLRGPIPMSWVADAGKQGGASLLVGLILWHLSGMNKNDLTVTLSNIEAGRWGVTRQAKSRALLALDRAGLVSVNQKGNKSPRVTIIEPVEE
jgi:hypothetical protein